MTVSRQKRYLVTTEVNPNRDGSLSDVSTLGTDCFWSLRKARIRINRQVHMEQALHQHGSVKVDETLNIKGKVESVDETPVGAKTKAVPKFLRGDGSVAVSAETVTLKLATGKRFSSGGSHMRSNFRSDCLRPFFGDDDVDVMAYKNMEKTPEGARILYVASTGALECEPLIQASKQ